MVTQAIMQEGRIYPLLQMLRFGRQLQKFLPEELPFFTVPSVIPLFQEALWDGPPVR